MQISENIKNIFLAFNAAKFIVYFIHQNGFPLKEKPPRFLEHSDMVETFLTPSMTVNSLLYIINHCKVTEGFPVVK